jgi:hypothetical protein
MNRVLTLILPDEMMISNAQLHGGLRGQLARDGAVGREDEREAGNKSWVYKYVRKNQPPFRHVILIRSIRPPYPGDGRSLQQELPPKGLLTFVGGGLVPPGVTAGQDDRDVPNLEKGAAITGTDNQCIGRAAEGSGQRSVG